MEMLHLGMLLEKVQWLLLVLQTDQFILLAWLLLALVQALEVGGFPLLPCAVVLSILRVVELAWVG